LKTQDIEFSSLDTHPRLWYYISNGGLVQKGFC
jgi:hypothetical protein